MTENGFLLTPFENGTVRFRLRDCLSLPKPTYNSECAAKPLTFTIPPLIPPLHKGGSGRVSHFTQGGSGRVSHFTQGGSGRVSHFTQRGSGRVSHFTQRGSGRAALRSQIKWRQVPADRDSRHFLSSAIAYTPSGYPRGFSLHKKMRGRKFAPAHFT